MVKGGEIMVVVCCIASALIGFVAGAVVVLAYGYKAAQRKKKKIQGKQGEPQVYETCPIK